MRIDRPHSRAFVLLLGPATDIKAGQLEGRVEHVASTRSAQFRSLDELMAALASMLGESDRSGPDEGRKA